MPDVTKKTVCTSLQLNNNDDSNEDVNGNPVNNNQSQSYNHPDVAQIDSLQKEMGKELAYKSDSQEATGLKTRKNRREDHYILAEDIPDYRGRDKIEDILKFIGKNPSNETLNKSLERKKKSKRKGLNGHVLRSGIGNMDAKSELSDSESTNLCPTKSPSFLDKEFCNCDNSEIDSCLDDDSCLAHDSFVSSPGNSAPTSAEPFILVEKKNKKKVYPNNSSSSSSNNNSRPNKYLSSKSSFRNRKLNSTMAHPHHTHHQFNCGSKTELDSSFPDLESSYHKMRRNSTGNVVMSMSTVQSITLEDSDNESWKSLPISQGARLINEKSYPVSYAKIAASSLPSNPTTLMGNSSTISSNDDGGGGGSCSSGSGGSMSSDGAVEEKNVDEENDANVKDGNSSTDNSHCKVGCTQNDSDKNKYLLRDNYDNCSNVCMNCQHSIGECVGSPEAAIDSVTDTKQQISRSHHLLNAEDGGSSDINADCQISFCDHKSVTSVEELVSKLSLKDSSPSSSIETLTPNTADAETKTPGDNQVVSSTSATQQQSCNSSSSSNSGVSDDALAVKFINPRDRRHNDKQFKITFGFFCDMDARNNPQGNSGSEEEITHSNLSLRSSIPPPPPLFPPTSHKILEMFAVPPLQQDFENTNDRIIVTTNKESEDGQPVSTFQNTDFVTGGGKKDNSKPITAINTTTSSSSSASVGAICDHVKTDVKPVDVDIKSASKLNGLVLRFVDKTCLTTSSSVTPVSEQADTTNTTTTTAIIISTTTTTSTTKKSITSPALTKTISTTVSSTCISGTCDSHQLKKLVCSNSVTDASTAASTTTSVNSNFTNNNNNNNASATVDNAADSTVLEEFGLIPLSYGNKIKADNKKVIHFRSDEADAQLFNQEEVLSYLSKEYHRVCQLSGPSTIVRVGTE